MLTRAIRLRFSSLAKDLNSKMSEVQSRLDKVFPASILEGTPHNIPEETPQKTMDERLSELDSKVAKIEGLREAGRPEEIRIKNLPMKYGRTGRHPAYPWYGEAVAPADRVPYLADRLGKYAGLVPTQTDLHEWAQAKSDMHNPLFHSFFVQEPTQQPDPDVDFEKGEIIYENPDAFRGVALAKQTGFLSIVYTTFYAAHTIISGRTVYPIGTEAMDHRSDGFNQGQKFITNMYNYGADWHDLENLSRVAFLMPAVPLAFAAAVAFVNAITDRVAVKIQFNKNKDLVFITKNAGVIFPRTTEEVYETTHLQVLPPTPKSGYEFVSDRTVFTITCMNSHDTIKVNSDPKYWNPELKYEFDNHLYSLWG